MTLHFLCICEPSRLNLRESTEHCERKRDHGFTAQRPSCSKWDSLIIPKQWSASTLGGLFQSHKQCKRNIYLLFCPCVWFHERKSKIKRCGRIPALTHLLALPADLWHHYLTPLHRPGAGLIDAWEYFLVHLPQGGHVADLVHDLPLHNSKGFGTLPQHWKTHYAYFCQLLESSSDWATVPRIVEGGWRKHTAPATREARASVPPFWVPHLLT